MTESRFGSVPAPGREWIEDVVIEIMINDGPDRHIDGYNVITDFIEALLAGRGEEWAREYSAKQI